MKYLILQKTPRKSHGLGKEAQKSFWDRYSSLLTMWRKSENHFSY